MRDSEKKTALVLCLLGGLGCIYLAVLLAPCLGEGLVYAAAEGQVTSAVKSGAFGRRT